MGFSKDTPLFVSSPHRQSNTISTPSGASLKMIWLFKCLTVAKDRDRWGPYVLLFANQKSNWFESIQIQTKRNILYNIYDYMFPFLSSNDC